MRLAWLCALAYLLVIAYASLQPFQGWRAPPPEILRFLTAPLPRWITLEDIAVNVAAYAPLGFLLSIGWGARLGPGAGVLAAAGCAAALSLAMESAQMFLPARIASNVDLAANSLGALVGAMAAPLFAPARILGGKLHAMRHRFFREGMAADAGLVVVCLWPITQFHPTAQFAGTGFVRATFELPAYFAHTPLLALAGEAAVVLFNVLGVGLLIAALTRDASGRAPFIAAGLGAALAVKTFTALALAKAPGPLAWITPGVSLGLLAGAVMLYFLVALPRRAQLAVAGLSVALATAAVNLAPDNPYQTLPPQLVAGGRTHFLSFSGIVRALSELWPLLAVGYLAYAASARGGPEPRALSRAARI